MKRRPVFFYLVLLVVALFADDVKFIVDLPKSSRCESTATVTTDTSTTQTAIRLLDSEGSMAEVARRGRTIRDDTAKAFRELFSPFIGLRSRAAAAMLQPPPTSSSLVSQHTRLQI
ncbi:MAG: hypothetical protein H6822_19120 [Planctomycetaceae bacterium]|nr:hypothetical protein [Planctomycetales bacterium]MCB9924299.1 hypothetical protein [Planctomycetaceae bacterium]